MSLYDWPLTGTHTFVGLKNFITLFTKDILFFKVMKNTFVYVIAYVALNVVIAGIAGIGHLILGILLIMILISIKNAIKNMAY